MKNVWSLLLAAALSVPAFAQDEATGEEYPEYGAEESEAADTGYYEETVPVEVAEEEEEESDPLPLYAGFDYVLSTFSSSNVPGFGANDFDSGMYRVKFGTRLFEKKVGVEVHYGLDAGGDGADEVSTDSYYGIFVVPTGVVLDLFEVALPVGYAMTSVGGAGGSADLDSIAYGLDVQLPLRLYGETLPDVRIMLGWMVYYQKSDARLYGANLGVRYDFTTESLGNPFAWIGDIDLWPFGDDE